MSETWRDVVGYERYKVSNFGRVRSFTRCGKGRVLAPKRQGAYLAVQLYKGGGSAHFSINKLVLLAFIGPRPDGMQCRHLDGNPHNNRLDNLQWGTVQENADDRKRHGTIKTRDTGRYGTKLTSDQVRLICIDQRVSTVIAHEYGVSPSLVRNIRCGLVNA